MASLFPTTYYHYFVLFICSFVFLVLKNVKPSLAANYESLSVWYKALEPQRDFAVTRFDTTDMSPLLREAATTAIFL